MNGYIYHGNLSVFKLKPDLNTRNFIKNPGLNANLSTK